MKLKLLLVNVTTYVHSKTLKMGFKLGSTEVKCRAQWVVPFHKKS